MAVTRNTQKKSFVALLIILLGVGGFLLYPFLPPLLLGTSLTVIFYPVHAKLLKWTKGRKGLSALTSVVLMLLFFIVPITLIALVVVNQLTDLVSETLADRTSLSTMIQMLHSKLDVVLAKIESLTGTPIDLPTLLKSKLEQLSEIAAKYSAPLVSQSLNLGLGLFILLISSFYLFRDGEEILEKLVRISPIKDRYEYDLISEVKKTIQGVFYGSFLTSLVQATLATIGYLIVGLDGFLVWGLLTFLMSFVPMVGIGLVMAPIVGYLFLSGQIGYGIFLLIFGLLAVGAADNIIRPLLIQSRVHPLLLFLSVLSGIAVFGGIGLLLGPIVMAVLTATLHIYEKDFL
jgi:predicted PurR-regulated permease PerM